VTDLDSAVVNDSGPTPARVPHVVVIGGGISGLAAAWSVLRDAEQAVRVTVFEANKRVGGDLKVIEVAGVAMDGGAEAMLQARPEAIALARQVGLSPAIEHPLTTQASVLLDGRLRALPARTLMGVPTDLRSLAAADVLSLPALMRLPFERRSKGDVLTEDISVGDFLRPRIGDEVVDRLVEPLLAGVYAGHADSLSLQASVPALYRALKREPSVLVAAQNAFDSGASRAGARRGPVFAGIRGGVGRLALSTSAGLRERGAVVRTSTTVRSLTKVNGEFVLEVGPANASERVTADAVIVALPPVPAAKLLKGVSKKAAAKFADAESASVAVVALAYRVKDVPGLPAGSGYLVPPNQRRPVKAVTIATSKWGWLARAAHNHEPDGFVLVRASVGRLGEDAILQRSDDELATIVHRDIRGPLGARRKPVDVVVQRWGGALPQYQVGHIDRVARIRAAVADVPGLAVCGAFYDGLGIAACVGTAFEAASLIRAGLPVN
jgi:oxygen-dependent protoporphyrinogen oxidase